MTTAAAPAGNDFLSRCAHHILRLVRIALLQSPGEVDAEPVLVLGQDNRHNGRRNRARGQARGVPVDAFGLLLARQRQRAAQKLAPL